MDLRQRRPSRWGPSSNYPWYDMSYMMIGSYPLPEWLKLYSGQIPWTSPVNSAQLSNWAKLKSSGCTNATC
jgi:hypothetical protein